MTNGRFTDIPVVDVGAMEGPPSARESLASELRDICHRVGFFVAVNHGVEASFVDAVFEMMHRFFALPAEHKSLIDKRRSPQFRGWETEGAEYTNGRPDFREQIDLWTEWPALAPDVQPEYLRLLGPNQWLPDELLPGHRELSLEWFAEMGALAERILGTLSLGLGLSEDHLRRFFGDQPMSLTKFIRYPPTPPGQAGVNAHHDAGFLTVLAPGPTPGLQVENPDGEWIDVPQVPGGFVINLGEMLQGMTGNYFVATPHRVVTRETRFSAAYFHGPSLDAALDPLPLAPELLEAVAGSPRHSGAGFMTRGHETEAGVADMASSYRPAVYGEQLWNYLARSYPENMALHHG